MLSALHNRICITILIFFTTISLANAQQASFIYFQSENNLPYQIKYKDQNYPSSSTGYLVIPQVMPGEHSLVVAFSPEIAPEYSYKIAITDKPRGFSIRQSADNKWSLFDMIDFSSVDGSMLVKLAKPVETDKLVEIPIPAPVEKKVTETPVQVVVEKKPVETPKQAAPEKKPVENPPVSAPAENPVVKKADPLPKKETITKSVIIQKIFDKEGSSGIDQVYIVQNGTKSDTIALFIPVLKDDLIKQTPGQSAYKRDKNADTDIVGLVFIRQALYPGIRTHNGLLTK